jgi:hypothetical protein
MKNRFSYTQSKTARSQAADQKRSYNLGKAPKPAGYFKLTM